MARSIFSVSMDTSKSPSLTRVPCGTALSTSNSIHSSPCSEMSYVCSASKMPSRLTSILKGCFLTVTVAGFFSFFFSPALSAVLSFFA